MVDQSTVAVASPPGVLTAPLTIAETAPGSVATGGGVGPCPSPPRPSALRITAARAPAACARKWSRPLSNWRPSSVSTETRALRIDCGLLIGRGSRKKRAAKDVGRAR